MRKVIVENFRYEVLGVLDDILDQCIISFDSTSEELYGVKATNDEIANETYLFSRSDLKNYSGTIELFFNWFQDISADTTGECIGWSWYEEDIAPTLVYKE